MATSCVLSTESLSASPSLVYIALMEVSAVCSDFSRQKALKPLLLLGHYSSLRMSSVFSMAYSLIIIAERVGYTHCKQNYMGGSSQGDPAPRRRKSGYARLGWNIIVSMFRLCMYEFCQSLKVNYEYLIGIFPLIVSVSLARCLGYITIHYGGHRTSLCTYHITGLVLVFTNTSYACTVLPARVQWSI